MTTRPERRTKKHSTEAQDTQVSCILCHGQTTSPTTPSSWKNEGARMYVSSLNIPTDAPVCPACRKDITRVLSDSEHVPRWMKMSSVRECCVQGCKNQVYASFHKITNKEVEQIFSSCGFEAKHTTIPVPVPLCKHHYHLVYNKVQPRQQHCVTCGISLRKQTNSKICPQPAIIEQHLKENVGFEGKIKEGDKICYTCYRSHLIILQTRKETSMDSDLLEVINTLSHQIHEPSHNNMKSTSDLVEAAMMRVVVTVGRELLDGNVMLLPDVHKRFNSYASELSQYLHEDVNISKLVTSAYILSNLTANLEHHMTYTCTIKKYGTLIYRPNVDLRPALAQALWRIRSTGETASSGAATCNPPDHREVLDDLNSRACSHIASYLSKCEQQPFDFLDLDIDKEIENTDPKLWEAICLLTRSTSERKGLAKVTDPSSAACHTKKVRRFFLLSTLLHCINDRYTNPLHTYITDLIEGQGGSALLIKVTNQLGACSSSDTLSRYIQNKVSNPKERMTQSLSQDSFTVVTVDNVDFLHSYARVYKGSNNSSWHGTTIQAVQPLPSLSQAAASSTTSSNNSSHRHLPTSPPGSAHVVHPHATQNTQQMDTRNNCLRTVGESSYVNTEATPLEQANGNTEITSLSQATASITTSSNNTDHRHLEGLPTSPAHPHATQNTQQMDTSNDHSNSLRTLGESSCEACIHVNTEVTLLEQANGNTEVTSLSQATASITTSSNRHLEDLLTSPPGSAHSHATQNTQQMDTSNDHSNCLRTVGESSCEAHVNIEANRTTLLEQANGNTEIIYRCTLNRKKRGRASPFQSPKQLTRSPAPKKQRRPRTGTEQPTSSVKANPTSSCQFENACKETIQVDKNLSDFLPNDQETLSLNEFQEEIHTYMMQKVALECSETSKTFLNLQDYLSLTRANHTERSNVLYLDVMDAKSDSKDTLMSMLQDLHQEFILKQKHQHLVVEGDAKIYELLQSLKLEYGDELQWLIPYPGDWHLLMNYQSALIKPYFDAGLKTLAEACGYPIAAIQNCTQFKRTHHFIMESWEALYRAMLDTFIEASSGDDHSTEACMPQTLLERVKTALNKVDQDKRNFKKAFGASVTDITSTILPTYEPFKDFIRNMARSDETWRFWVQYVFVDAMAYVSLFLAMRSGDWHLRMSSIKNMAPLFTAFDHQTYQKLISNHISDLLSLPKSVLLMFEQGAFVVNIRGRSWHSVGMDEAHEMLINKQCKTSITKPNPDFINRIAKYLTHRAEALEHFKQQVFPKPNEQSHEVPSIFTSKDSDKKTQTNVKAQLVAIKGSSMLNPKAQHRGLLNPFTGARAVGQALHDLLNFRDIGREDYLIRISYFILRNPSVKAPNRRQTLKTFSTKIVTKKRVNNLERDRRLVMSAIKKKILFSKKTGTPIERPGEQISEYPLSISDSDGNPIKGQKSYFTKSIEGRYKSSSTPVITPYLPAGWIPECSIVEGMFIINTSPLRTHATMADYARFLLRRFVVSQFTKGGKEIHVIFDNPGRLQNTPKYFEQKRRDRAAKVSADHTCDEITSSTVLPHKKWRENFINCRTCKRNLVKFIGNYFLHNAGTYLAENQTLYVAGAFDGHITDTAWLVHGQQSPQPDPRFACTAEETDTRMWLHVRKTECKNILIMSPDTDVYNIGLPLPSIQEKEIIIRISTYSAREPKFLHLSGLVSAFRNDPDLARIRPDILLQVFQMIYVTTGSDYTSFFSEIGKATFLRYLFQYAAFITAGNDLDIPGTLADTQLEQDKYKLGYLAFIRLVGTVYFKKHSSGFQTQCPQAHFATFKDENLSIEEQHLKWLDDIRQTIWYRTKFENEMIASDDALMLHWKRSCWVVNMWKQADKKEMQLQPVTSYGWCLKEGELKVEWDTESNISTIRARVHALTKGCKCTTGCATNRCSCRRWGNKCSLGCDCINCANIQQSNTNNPCRDTELRDLAIEEEHTTDEMMMNIFGRSPGSQQSRGSDTDSDTEEPIVNRGIDSQKSDTLDF